ncbi:MAG: Na/Pi cotransporter family protein [Parvibaculaceae bacterium]
MEIFLDIFAGLGLFFVGVKLIGANLKQLTGKWFRGLMAAATESSLRSSLLGLLSGALTQSSNAITFISISMVMAGLVEVAGVVPMVIWANVGTSLLVLVAAVDTNLAVLFLLGVTGVAYYFDLDNKPRFRHGLGAVLGLSLLFMGLELIKQGSVPLRSVEGVADFLSFAASSYFLAFLIGVILTMVAQSSATVTIIAVAMTNAGLLTLDQTIAIVIGASLGSGLSIGVLTINLKGIGRQIALMQIAVKIVGVAVFLPVFVLEVSTGLAGIKALVSLFTPHLASQVALVYLFLQVVSAVITMALRKPITALIARHSPPTDEELLSQPRYLYDEALEDASSALELVEREQARAFGYLPDLLDGVRDDAVTMISAQALHVAGQSLIDQCDAFLAEIVDQNEAKDILPEVFNLQKRNEILSGLFAALGDYVQTVSRIGPRPVDDKFVRLIFALGESLHTILDLGKDAFHSRDRDDLATLLEFTSDRSAQMDGIRRGVMSVGDMTPADHSALYASTTLFERVLWLTRRYGELAVQMVPDGEME